MGYARNEAFHTEVLDALEAGGTLARPMDVARALGLHGDAASQRVAHVLKSRLADVTVVYGLRWYGLAAWGLPDTGGDARAARLEAARRVLLAGGKVLSYRELAEAVEADTMARRLFRCFPSAYHVLRADLAADRRSPSPVLLSGSNQGALPGLVAAREWHGDAERHDARAVARRERGGRGDGIRLVAEALESLGRPSTSAEVAEHLLMAGLVDLSAASRTPQQWVENTVSRDRRMGGDLVIKPRSYLLSLPVWGASADAELGEPAWACMECRQWLPRSAFYEKGAGREAPFGQCKSCYATLTAERKRTPEYRERMRERRAGDRLVRCVSSAMSTALRRGGGDKARRHWEDLVGYTAAELIAHVESLFEGGMSWGNYGLDGGSITKGWHLDHVRPKASFPPVSSPEDPAFQEMFALDNLAPSWGRDNMSKSSVWQGRKWTYRDWE